MFVDGRVPKLFLDFQKPVVFFYPLGSARCACLDLSGTKSNGNIRNRRVSSLAGAVRNNRAVSVFLRHADRVKRLSQRANLIDLYQHRMGCMGVNPVLEPSGIGHKQIVSHKLGL